MNTEVLNLHKAKKIQIHGKWGQTYRYAANTVKLADLWQHQFSAKQSEIFRKLSAYVKIRLPELIINVCVHATWGSNQTIIF